MRLKPNYLFATALFLFLLYNAVTVYALERDLSLEPINSAVRQKLQKESGAVVGNYFALVIGNNDYKVFSDLRTALNDAKVVAKVLHDNYGFNTKLLLNATRADILKSLSNYRKTLTNRDNLLIYYAGHGWLDEDANEGYWLPVNATRKDKINWVSNNSITSTLKAMRAKHVLVVADSCYSGKLVRGVHIKKNTPDYITRISKKKARVVLASGGLEPVADSGGKGNHSVFASAFIEALRENNGVMDGTELFSKIRRPVMVNSDQTPEYADIRKAGHDGGDFIFVNTVSLESRSAQIERDISKERQQLEKERQALALERRRFEEEKLIMLERQRLAKERRKLEEEKKRIKTAMITPIEEGRVEIASLMNEDKESVVNIIGNPEKIYSVGTTTRFFYNSKGIFIDFKKEENKSYRITVFSGEDHHKAFKGVLPDKVNFHLTFDEANRMFGVLKSANIVSDHKFVEYKGISFQFMPNGNVASIKFDKNFFSDK